jgi:cytochrome c biogenesis protein CcmG, thiol:disulfide interchange protein DsbE
MKAKFLVPLALFLVLVGFLAFGLNLNPREVPSPLIGKPAPAFRLAQVSAPERSFGVDDLKGQVWLLNVWASWCVACREEHPVLVALSKDKVLPIVGLNYKEVRGDGEIDARKLDPAAEREMAVVRARQWLASHGDPYTTSVLDLDGRVGIDFGVYGVPETFLIDKQGVIRYKHVGPVTPDVWRNTLLPKIQTLQAEA